MAGQNWEIFILEIYVIHNMEKLQGIYKKKIAPETVPTCETLMFALYF